VRGLQFVSTGKGSESLVSASEDCTIKLWDASKFGSLKELGSGDIEPYLTVRGHRRPITALSGRDLLFP
jgi:WD40 repeat protein